ncbi:MAG: xylulokinase [Armatimonadetes bacterium]|nr:xylulokinase [Armatimonadota bacterium]MDW8122521.1 xylulokinase [Armatimonadota bacterium]
MPFVIGIDVGTSSTKAVLVSDEGEVIASSSVPYRYHTPRPGWVEQDPDDWWEAVCQAIRNLLQTAHKEQKVAPDDIKGISLSGQMNGAVLTDAAGRPFRPAILWLDNRSEPQCQKVNQEKEDDLVSATGQTLNPVNTLAKLLWIKEEEPETYRSARWAFLPKDWIRFRLTGTATAEVSDSSATGLMHIEKRVWNEPLLSALSLRLDWLPPLAESTDIVGAVTREAAEETGLKKGTVVGAGGGDMPCLAVGTGCIEPGIVCVGIGTAGHCTTYAETLNPVGFRKLWPMCHSVPGKYFWLGCSFTCGAALQWWSSQWDDPLEDLIGEAEKVPPGADGLFFVPWLQGSATPYPDGTARGGWLGLSLHHQRAHLTRALLEGVAFDLRQSLDTFRQVGVVISEVRIAEGGSRSPVWRQIQSDVFGSDLIVLQNPDASVLGAAIIAGVGTGLFPDFPTACSRTVRLGETIVCDRHRAALYDQMYHIYRNLYPSLISFFSSRYRLERSV